MTRAGVSIVLFVPVLAVFIASRSEGISGRVSAQTGASDPAPVVVSASRHDASLSLRSMPVLSPQPLMAEAPAPGSLSRRDQPGPEVRQLDPALQTVAGVAVPPTPLLNFSGLDNVDLLLPPDPNGDIGYDPATGKKHYVQMVNVSFGIWDVTGAPNLVYGPARNDTLWQGFGGPCEATDNGETAKYGDPIVLFDGIAHRWLMSQFALLNNGKGPYYECIAVSRTGDPTGGWYRYEFKISDTVMNDYPKFGVWPDGYYMSINLYRDGSAAIGAGAVVFERDKMLLGQAARMVFFDLSSVDPTLDGLLPSDLDGPLPPLGAPDPFVRFDDDAWGHPLDQLEIWAFHTDWANPGSSKFAKVATVATAAFDSNVCYYRRDCIPQPDPDAGLDALADRMMYRLQYRNFGSYEAMVTNHTVDVDGADRAGVRWYELRKSGANWGIYQQGTYSPDSNNRWMGSVAMDKAGNISLGYSVSSSTVYPSIRYTGRLSGDPLGQMTLEEGVLVAGTGSQLHSASRWGDYSMMAVDPADDCTFWYTQEYYETTSELDWQTRIGAFQLSDDCTPPPTATPTATLTPTSTPTATSTPTPTATSTAYLQWRYLPMVLRGP
jgi:hypothetical protein